MGKMIKLKSSTKLGRLFSKKKLIIVIIASLILICGVVVCYWYFVINRPSSVATPNDQSNSIDEVAAFDKSQNRYIQAVRAVSVAGYDAGQSFLDDEISSNTNNDTERSYLYIQKSTLAINNSNISDAITFAEKAEGLYQSRISAVVLAHLYEEKGDKASTVKYYELAIERTTDQEKNILPSDYEYYQSKIEELSK